MISKRLSLLILFAGLLLVGCNPAVRDTREHVINDEGETMEAAYEKLLSEPAWDASRERQRDGEEDLTVVTVEGTLADTKSTFQGRFQIIDGAPELIEFTVNGEVRDPADFAAFLSDYYLHRSLHGR